MATGLQTGRRPTGAAPARTGAAPAKGPGGIGDILSKWNEMDSKKKTIVIAVVAFIVVAAIAINVVVSSNKMVPLYNSTLSSADVQAIQIALSNTDIQFAVAEGGTNILVNPKSKRRAITFLASQGLPSRPLIRTNVGGKDQGGLAPPTSEEKARKALKELSGDLTDEIRQIEGIADAYITIVPVPKDNWGGEEKKATASVMLKLKPGAKLSPRQVDGIQNLIAYSVEGLDTQNIKIIDSTGRLLSGTIGNAQGGGSAYVVDSDGNGYTNPQLEERRAVERDLQQKVQSSLSKMFGGRDDKFDVQVSVELDHSQKRVESIHHGGPGNTDGRVTAGEQIDKENYSSKGGKSDGVSGGADTMSATSSNTDNYGKISIKRNYKVDSVKKESVTTTATIKRIQCAVLVDGIKDPNILSQIKMTAENAAGIVPSRGDSLSVASVPFLSRADVVNTSGGGAYNSSPPWGERSRTDSAAPQWLWALLGIPVVLIVLMIALFMVKQKSVQKEKQRLVLTTGPGATVSDISDLLADKEGKVTTPPATKVNTTEQLEKLAKEKPTKVAELLKSTWLADK